MAGPTSANAFTRVVIGLLGVLLLIAFSFTVYFFGVSQRKTSELEEFQQQVARIVSPGEENSDRVQRFLQSKPGSQSLVAYLGTSFEQAMERVTGDRALTYKDFETRLEAIPGADSEAILQLLQQSETRAADADARAQAAQAAKEQAQSDMQEAMDQIAQIQNDHASELSAKDDLLTAYRSDLDKYNSDLQATIDRNNQRVDDVRRAAASREASLQNEIARREQDILVQRDMIEQLRTERQATALRPQDEFSLVDAQVISANITQGVVFLNVGRKQRVVLGMTFQIYSDAAAIKPGDNGSYSPGKATVEVIRINDTSCAARVIRQARGNTLAEGDVAANALYDPNKTYTFLVFGIFDTDRDGRSTPQETNTVKALINEWGGDLVDDLTGAVDFVVLGERPVLPPEPPLDSPPAVMRDYISRRQLVDKYDELFHTASQTGIPVLNVNRLYTLTGLDARR